MRESQRLRELEGTLIIRKSGFVVLKIGELSLPVTRLLNRGQSLDLSSSTVTLLPEAFLTLQIRTERPDAHARGSCSLPVLSCFLSTCQPLR